MNIITSRRRVLQAAAFTASSLFVPGVMADVLTKTPGQTEGPFYPNKLPLDTDNDLIVLNDNITPAVGEISHITGRILDAKGDPVRNAMVEIWQVDNNASYLHTDSTNRDKYDRNFQGFGKFLTGSTGEYYFRTIKPVPYPGRTPHIHYMVKTKGHGKFTTQLYVKGHPQNATDGIYKGIVKDIRHTIESDFAPIPNSPANELSAKFDIVLGYTPEG